MKDTCTPVGFVDFVFACPQYMHLTSISHAPHIDLTSTPGGTLIDVTPIPHRPFVGPTLTSHQSHINMPVLICSYQ